MADDPLPHGEQIGDHAGQRRASWTRVGALLHAIDAARVRQAQATANCYKPTQPSGLMKCFGS